MALQFGIGQITVSGIAIARLMNLNFTISYDNAQLRGGNLIFPTDQQLYNGAIEGSFEVGDINITNIAAMLGADASHAGGSGTMTITATQVLATGADIVVSAVTNGVTGTLTFNNCKFNSVGVTVDRENYTIPSTNFVVIGTPSTNEMMTWQI
jgi:hypothetical protein